MSNFEFRNKIEGWIEGLLDVIQTYIWTVLQLHLRPSKSMRLLASPHDNPDVSSPSIYFVLSYLVMCLLIQDVNFSDPMFSVNLADSLDALGVLSALKTIKVETLVVSFFPAIIILLFFVIIATTVLKIAGDNLDSKLIRRNYSFSLGSMFLTIGTVSGGYHYLVKPLAVVSWWAGLPIHILTMLPIVSAIYSMLAIQYIGLTSKRQLFFRWIAIIIPLIGISLLLKLTIGSFYLMDYTRLR